MIRYLIHSPHFRKTPRALARLIPNCIARPYTAPNWPLTFNHDIFAAYPNPRNLLIVAADRPRYLLLHHFSAASKGKQRLQLEAQGLPTLGAILGPASLPPGHWLVRPAHHFGGSAMTIWDGGNLPSGYYASALQPIQKEFRTVFVRGVPLFTMFKPSSNDPLTGDLFEETWSYTRLDRCGLLEQLCANPIVAGASYCAVDIAWFGRRAEVPAKIVEVNFAPGLGPKNLALVAAALAL